MKNTLDLVYLIPLLPLIGFLINGLGRKLLSKGLIGIIGSGTVFISFLISVWVFMQVKGGNTHVADYFTFITVDKLSIPFAFQIDPIC